MTKKKEHKPTAKRRRNRVERRRMRHERWLVAMAKAKFAGVPDDMIEAYRGHLHAATELESHTANYERIRQSAVEFGAAKGLSMTGRQLPGKHFTQP
jgi:hypothetical protein